MSNDLIARLGAAEGEDNALDVLCEIALFKPGTCYTAIRANNAGTKVIYTDQTGKNITCWAEPWSAPSAKASTIAALKAKENSNG